MSTTTTALMALANCYQCAADARTAMKLALLASAILTLNPMADTSPANLMAVAACHGCSTGGTLADTLEMGLLILLVQNVGVSGTAMVFSGTGSPEGVVTAPVGALYSEIAGGVLIAQWVKASGSGNTGWV